MNASATTDGSDTEANNDIVLIIKRVNSLWPPVKDRVESSEKYMKRLTSVAISYILYLRKFFTKNYFEVKPLEYLRLMILKDTIKSAEVTNIVQMIRGCFKAIDEKRLKKLVVRMHPPVKRKRNQNQTIETYILNYTYDSEKFNISLDMKENNNRNRGEELCVLGEDIRTLDVKQSIDQLLRSLRLKCESLDRLADDTFFEMTYFTYDNSYVEGFGNQYIPPNFRPFTESNKRVSKGAEAGTSGTQSDCHSCSDCDNKNTHEILSMSMSGQDNLCLSDDKKLRAFIKTEVKPEIKTEPGIKTEIKEEFVN